jgi:asparagine synthase (glutamine-hydrolysing)
MCGFAGYAGGAVSGQEALSVLRRMSDAIAHRGPDDFGCWVDDEVRVGLAHRRLAVLDLTAAGHQPMVSAGAHLVLIFNGEIYNHQELRRELALHGRFHWRGRSDTETLLAGFEAWGVERTLTKAVGMFGLALWNRHTRVLHLARDRIGEKPVYFGWQEREKGKRAFVFGSELRALVQHPAFVGEVCRDAMREFVRYGNVPGTRSIYRDIQKLSPGSILTLNPHSAAISIKPYWRLEDVVTRQRATAISRSIPQALIELEGHIAASVRQQILADVPVGAFLSGGIDSSLIVALMCRESSRTVKTFSVGFENPEYNEAPFAETIAKHLGTDHAEIYLSNKTAIEFIPRFVGMLDEPFADSSQIATYFVSKLARESVTVVLSGDAGDELFGGYNRYLFTSALWSKISKLGIPFRRLLGAALRSVVPIISDHHNFLIPKSLRLAGLAEKVQKAAFVFAAKGLEDLYLGLLSMSPDADQMLSLEPDARRATARALERPAGLSNAESMMFWDTLNYLPDDILVKVDRAAMDVSLETRIPLLDHRLVEFSWSLPSEIKLRKTGSGYVTKWGLRQILYNYVPRELIERPKKGFAVPVGDWIRGPLREWAGALLDRRNLESSGILNVPAVLEAFNEHQSGKRNWQHKLWTVLILQGWLDREMRRTADAGKP